MKNQAADLLVCQGLGAAAIKDELVGLLPDNLWFVSVQPSSGSWATGINGMWGEGADSYYSENNCEKNLYVWTFSGPLVECSPNTGDMAQKLIDDAVAAGGPTSYIRDYITMSMPIRFLTLNNSLF